MDLNGPSSISIEKSHLGQILFERKLATVGLQDRDRATRLADWALSLLPLTCGLKTALLLVRMNLELLALQAYYLRLWGSTINIRFSRQWLIHTSIVHSLLD